MIKLKTKGFYYKKASYEREDFIKIQNDQILLDIVGDLKKGEIFKFYVLYMVDELVVVSNNVGEASDIPIPSTT